MTKQATSPQYLPAIDRQLEYRAGLLTLAPATRPAAQPRQWLGTDFTCSVESRRPAADASRS